MDSDNDNAGRGAGGGKAVQGGAGGTDSTGGSIKVDCEKGVKVSSAAGPAPDSSHAPSSS